MRRALVVTAILTFVIAGPAGATRLPQAEREAINRTLDRFVDTAVKSAKAGAKWVKFPKL